MERVMEQQMTSVQERIQQDVKTLIGDLNLQVIMLRSELIEARQQLQQLEMAKANGSRPPSPHADPPRPPARDA
jgi:hypothetical protein